MKRLSILLVFALALVSFNALAWDAPPAPNPPQSYIADVAHKLSATDLSKLNTKIRLVNRSSRNEIAVLIIPSLDGEEMSDVAHITFKKWGAGKKGLDNGVLILVAVAERRTRIEVGKGIEGDLTDLQSNDIIKTNMNPHFKTGDFFGGLSEAVDVISRTVENRKDAGAPGPIPSSSPPPVKPPAVPTTPRNDTGGCDVSAAGSTNESGNTMLLILAICAFVGFVVWRLRARAIREVETYSDPYPRYVPPPPPEPVYSPSTRLYSPPRTVVHTHTYGYGGVTGGGYPTHSYTPPPPPVYSPPPPPPPVEDDILPVIGVAAGAAAISSLFNDEPSTPSWSPSSSSDDSSSSYTPSSSSSDDSPSYDPPSYDAPSSSDDSGFGGGDSGGGGSDSSWDD